LMKWPCLDIRNIDLDRLVVTGTTSTIKCAAQTAMARTQAAIKENAEFQAGYKDFSASLAGSRKTAPTSDFGA
jgi:hypothetical protein